MKLRLLLSFLGAFIFRTLRFNFKYLPFNQAIRLPILVSRYCRIRKLSRNVNIDGVISTGMIRIGMDSVKYLTTNILVLFGMFQVLFYLGVNVLSDMIVK